MCVSCRCSHEAVDAAINMLISNVSVRSFCHMITHMRAPCLTTGRRARAGSDCVCARDARRPHRDGSTARRCGVMWCGRGMTTHTALLTHMRRHRTDSTRALKAAFVEQRKALSERQVSECGCVLGVFELAHVRFLLVRVRDRSHGACTPVARERVRFAADRRRCARR
jgi:hypothetical protein